jgi:hypothetical protein
MFSNADLICCKKNTQELACHSLTGGFRYEFTESQAAFCKHFQYQNCRFRVFEANGLLEEFSKILSNIQLVT